MTPKPSKYSFSGHSYPFQVACQPRLSCKASISLTFLSFQKSEELRCGYHNQPEHQMCHHLGCPAHPHEPSAIIVLQIRVDPLGCAAIPETHRLRRIHFFLLPLPGVGIDDRDMPQASAEAPDLRCIVGCVHQVVKTGRFSRRSFAPRG